jgi:hypothetical protein
MVETAKEHIRAAISARWCSHSPFEAPLYADSFAVYRSFRV